MNTYWIDGMAVNWQHLLQIAREHGYHEPDGLYTTSGAANHLRASGHEVRAAQNNNLAPAQPGKE